MSFSILIFRKITLAYGAACKPLCTQLGLTQTAFDILMFLGNNPAYQTASEIAQIRHIKSNLISVNVEHLVREGYLTRRPVKGDRRKTRLLCTEKAQSVLIRGRQLQQDFAQGLFAGMSDEMRSAFSGAIRIIEDNLDEMLEVSAQ